LQGELVLNCPGCGTKVADGTSICPKCDYIIDGSFLSSEPPAGNNDDDESTGAAPDPRKASPASRPVRPVGGPGSKTGTTGKVRAVSVTGKSGPRPAVAAGKSVTGRTGPRPAVRPAPPSRPPEPEPAPEPPAEPPPRKAILPPASPNRTFSTGTKIVAPEQMMEEAREFITELSRADKLAFGGAVAVILSCFLPWKETAADGDVLGLMSSGFGALLLPWMTQLIGSVICVLYTVVTLRFSIDTTEVPSAIGNALIMNSSPSLGVFIALLGGLGAMAGSLLGLKERPV
jgi:hypothetical protein